MNVKLWEEPGTFRVVKRTVILKELGTLTEIYDEVILNGKVPATLFRPTEGDKR